MDYLKIYYSIINKAKNDAHNRSDCYVERHHIIPKCMGGTNDIKNIVALTAREHFICHWLLWKAYRNIDKSIASKLGFAFVSFQRKSKWHKRDKLTSFEYEAINIANVESGRYSNKGEKNPMYCKPCYYNMTEEEKTRWRNNVRKHTIGENNPFYGKHHSEETKRILSEKLKGNNNWEKVSDEVKQRFYDMIHAPKSEEHRKKIGRKGYVNIRNIHTNECIRVHKSDPRVTNGDWIFQNKGITLKKTHTCPHCGILTDKAHYNRWHGDNCKQNPNKK